MLLDIFLADILILQFLSDFGLAESSTLKIWCLTFFRNVQEAFLAATTLFFILSGKAGFAIDNTKAGAFASNGFGAFSPEGYSMEACFVAEFVLTMMFLIIILGATDKFAHGKFAGIAIGLALTLIHLISIPITNTSVNPARSLSQALYVGGEPLAQVWLFWVAPIAGALVGGFIHKFVLEDKNKD